ncbi:MAG: hypothetical protein ACN6O6_05700 [Pseudomonas sp.]|uniref:hypothetical protein n=1 Tax=Pseudomonas sp. TaxID=306 RepID=UPI003D14D138
MIDVSLSVSAIAFVLIGIPYLFLLKKAGLSPYWCLLFLFTPWGLPLGAWLGFPLLALRAWPARNEVPNRYFLAVPQHVVLVAMHVVMPIFSFYVIFKKLNYSGWWCLSVLIPPAAVVVLWVCAFRKDNREMKIA